MGILAVVGVVAVGEDRMEASSKWKKLVVDEQLKVTRVECYNSLLTLISATRAIWMTVYVGVQPSQIEYYQRICYMKRLYYI